MPNVTSAAGVALEYEYLPGAGPVVVFCPGYASHMGGTKANALLAAARAREQAMLRFDYSGHGASGGDFVDGSISLWTADAAKVIEEAIPGQDIIFVGSSMGGWISLLLACELKARVKAMLLIAPATDFTERLIRPRLSAKQKAELKKTGVIHQPNEDGETLPLTQKFLEDGAQNLLLNEAIPVACPVHILHGMHDATVPWEMSLKLAELLESQNVRLNFVKDGDHRLSRPQDLRLLTDLFGLVLNEARW